VWHSLCTATTMFLPSRLSTTVSLAPQGDMMRGRGVVKVVHQAERKDAMQQVIVSKNDKEEVWVKTSTGHLIRSHVVLYMNPYSGHTPSWNETQRK
jgi:hypothetical protein